MKLVLNLIEFRHGENYGFEEYVINLLTHFVSHRNLIEYPEVIVVAHESQTAFLRPICGDAFTIVPLNYKNSWEKLLCNEKLEKKLNLTSSDVIFYPCNETTLIKGKAKSVVTMHDLLYRHNSFCAKTIPFYKLRLHRMLFVPKAVKYVDRIIAISQFTKKEVSETFGHENKIEVIYNYFCFNKYVDKVYRQLSINKPFILSISAGYVHKRQLVVIKSFEKFIESGLDYDLVMVGKLYKDAEEYYKRLPSNIKNKIHLLSGLSNGEISFLYSNASAYVSASLYEGLGMPIVEAMYFGVPVVLSDIDIHREVSFNEGIYCKIDDVDAFSNALHTAVTCAHSTQSIKSRIANRYSVDNTALQYIRVFNSLVNN